MMPTPKYRLITTPRVASLGLAALVLLSGCSLIDAKKDDYKRANRLPPLEIPPTLSTPTQDDRYTIPDPKDVAASATYSEYAKSRGLPTLQGGYVPGVGVDPQSAQAHIEVAGSDRWLTVNGTPDQVYNTVKTFLTENNYEVAAENAQLGTLETQWISGTPDVEDDGLIRNLIKQVFKNDNATGIRDRYRFRVDVGRKPGTSEIYVTHKGLEEVVAGNGDRTVWQPRASEPDKEAEMLKRLLLKFGVDIPNADKQLASVRPDARKPSADAADVASGAAAAATSGNAQVRLDTGAAGEPGLQLGEGFERGWRRLGLAIDKSGLALQDQDRDSGLYFVQYSADKVKDPAGDDKKSGKGLGSFFSQLGHSIWAKITDTDTSSPSKDKPVVLDTGSAPDVSAIKVPDGIYRLAVSQDQNNARVTVFDQAGKPAPADVSRKLLAVLAAQLR